MWSWNFDTVNKAVINISRCGDERERERDTNIPASRGPGRIRWFVWLALCELITIIDL